MRHAFICSDCGVRIVGRMDPRTGLIYAYDRAATSDDPPKPCVCMTCRERAPDLVKEFVA